MKKLVLTCLFIVSFQGCAEENYIKLSDNLKDDLKIEMYLANDDSCVKLDKPFMIRSSKVESLSEKPIITNADCIGIYYMHNKDYVGNGLMLLFDDEKKLEREQGDEMVLKINDEFVTIMSVAQKAKGKSFFRRMILSELEKYLKNKKKIYYDKIKEVEDLKAKEK